MIVNFAASVAGSFRPVLCRLKLGLSEEFALLEDGRVFAGRILWIVSLDEGSVLSSLRGNRDHAVFSGGIGRRMNRSCGDLE